MARLFFVIFCFIGSINCAMADTPWEQYLNLPNPANANNVSAISYTEKKAINDYDANDLAILALQVNANDRAAFRLAYRLREKSDGGLLEDLSVILGNTIRRNPSLFLEEMTYAKIDSASLETILLMAGLEYSDRPEAHLYELEMRYKAIDQVGEKNLETMRQKSLKILESQIDDEKKNLSDRVKVISK